MGRCNIIISDSDTWEGCTASIENGFIELRKKEFDAPRESCCYESWNSIENKRESECFWTSKQLFKVIGQKYDLDVTDFYH